jgi:predicted ribosome quality control (RQC) complex YloA/Tae2 family protein
MASKGRAYRSFCVQDYRVLVGRGASENDQLTFKIAAPRDLWLHIGGGTPGSHVVIQNPENTGIPREVVERAAELAAWFSKARNAGRVEVHVCRVADISKERGAPAGRVTLKRYDRVRVVPKAPDPTELPPGEVADPE